MIFAKANSKWYLLDGEMSIEVHPETIATHGGTIIVYDISSLPAVNSFYCKTKVFDIKLADIIIQQKGSKSLQSLSKKYLKKKVDLSDPLSVLKCVQSIFEKQKSKLPVNYVVELGEKFILMGYCFEDFIRSRGANFYEREQVSYFKNYSKNELVSELNLNPKDAIKAAFGLSSYFKSLDYLATSENEKVLEYVARKKANFHAFKNGNSSLGHIFESFFIDSFGLPGGACNLFSDVALKYKNDVQSIDVNGVEFRFVLSNKFKTTPDMSTSVYAQIYKMITGKSECTDVQSKMIERIISLMVRNEELIDIEDQLGMRGKLSAVFLKIDELLGIKSQIESMAQFACQMGYFKLYNDGIMRNRFSEEAKKAYSEAKNLLKPGLYELKHYDHYDGPERGLVSEYFITMNEVKKRAFFYYLKSLKSYMIWNQVVAQKAIGNSVMLVNQEKIFYIN